MFGRVLGTTLVQVARSIAFVLFPISFIALLAWATAGSATGNTGDPLRAALWIWLGAHQVPFSLALPPETILPFVGLEITTVAHSKGMLVSFSKIE